jgi:hypothetical protein
MIMIFWHFLEWLAAKPPEEIFTLVGNMSLGNLAPPIFLLVTGMTIPISIARRKGRGETYAQIRSHILKRRGTLILIGFGLNAILGGTGEIWVWDILETIGAANIITYFLLYRINSNLALIIIACLIALASPYVSSLSFLASLPILIHNMLVGGVFPLFPWLSFVIIGGVLGSLLIKALREKREEALQHLLLKAGFLLGGISLLLHLCGVHITYPLSFTYIGCSIGISILTFAALFWWQGTRQGSVLLKLLDKTNLLSNRLLSNALKPLMDCGIVALGIYIWHYLAIFPLVFSLGLYKTLSLSWAVALSLMLSTMVWLAALVWLKLRLRFRNQLSYYK